MATVNKKFKGNAKPTHLAAPITAGAPTGGGTFTVAAGDGANYPTSNFVVKFNEGGTTEEKVLCSARTGDVFTVASSGRGYDDTVASDHAVTETIVHELDAVSMTAIVDHVDNDSADDHSQYLNTTRHDVEARHTFGAALGTPGTPEPVGTVGSAGSGDNPAREDHVHAAGAAATGTVYFTNLGGALSQSFTAEVDLTGLTTITFTADGTSRYRLHFHATAVGAQTIFKLYEGATLLAILTQTTTTVSVDGWWEWVPSAGSHTLKIRGLSGSGTGRLDTFQAGGQDTYVSVEKIGSV